MTLSSPVTRFGFVRRMLGQVNRTPIGKQGFVQFLDFPGAQSFDQECCHFVQRLECGFAEALSLDTELDNLCAAIAWIGLEIDETGILEFGERLLYRLATNAEIADEFRWAAASGEPVAFGLPTSRQPVAKVRRSMRNW